MRIQNVPDLHPDELGLLDPEALRKARARVEWRSSLEMLDEVIAERCD